MPTNHVQVSLDIGMNVATLNSTSAIDNYNKIHATMMYVVTCLHVHVITTIGDRRTLY